MIDLIVFIIVLVLVVILVPRIVQGIKGCNGSCEQGRKPCNCKGNQDGLS